MARQSANVFLYNNLEIAIEKIFKEAGYSYKRGVHITSNAHADIDGVASNGEDLYVIEIKSRAYIDSLRRAGEYISNVATLYYKNYSAKAKAMVIVADVVKDEWREHFEKTFPNVELVDIKQLLYCVKDNEPVRKILIDSLDYSVVNIPTQKWNMLLLPASCDPADDLLRRLKSVRPGRIHASEYEILCVDIIEYLFGEVLWKLTRHEESNKGLYQFDAVARIKDNSEKTFWNLIEDKFNTKYIVFEFKNYKEPISQTQIYTTEKYLYFKALRCVAIVFSRKGANNNALWAANGCLRENGKLILVFDNKEIKMMINDKKAGKDPSEYLMEKLDKLLLKLEK